ncbi:MAG: VIT1/CCC1 transporter family protein, partial [Armatimonadetes bacterium]|nr:VIT1/CCC1 transporter family protein [Armatimonadota bacterium]
PLEAVVRQITANEETWLKVMMADELNLRPVAEGGALRSAFIVGFSAIVGSVIPLLPFFFVQADRVAMRPGILIALGVSALTLFAVGVYKARVTVGRPARSGAQMAVIGIVSALAGYVIGLLFAAPAGA